MRILGTVVQAKGTMQGKTTVEEAIIIAFRLNIQYEWVL